MKNTLATKDKNRHSSSGLSSYIMVIPALVLVFSFVVLPFILNVGYSFTDYTRLNQEVHFIGLTNFKNMFSDKSFSLVAWNTVKISLIYIVIINLLALIFAVLLSNVRRRFGSFIRTVVFIPQLLSMIVVGFLWRIMLSYKNGPVNALLIALGVSKDAVPQWLGNIKLVIPSLGFALIWLVTGYYLIIYYAGIMNIPVDYYEVCTLDGATPLQTFWYVTLPSLAPTIKINTVLLTIESLSVFAVPAAMTEGGGPGRYGTTFALWAYNTYFKNLQYGKGIAMSVVIGLVAIILALVEMRVLAEQEDE